MNIIYYLQFYLSSLFSVLFLSGYCYCYDISRKNIKVFTNPKVTKDIIKLYNNSFDLFIMNNLIINFFYYIFLIHFINNYKNYQMLTIIDIFKYFFYFYNLLDVPVFFMHKLFHTKYFYKFHRIHHQIKKPVSITAFHNHPIDHLCNNLIALHLPLFIFNTNFIFIHLWIIFCNYKLIMESHGGYKRKSEFHDYHHKNPRYNFGTNKFMDYLFNSKKEWIL